MLCRLINHFELHTFFTQINGKKLNSGHNWKSPLLLACLVLAWLVFFLFRSLSHVNHSNKLGFMPFFLHFFCWTQLCMNEHFFVGDYNLWKKRHLWFVIIQFMWLSVCCHGEFLCLSCYLTVFSINVSKLLYITSQFRHPCFLRS